jgi:hypothetical protein
VDNIDPAYDYCGDGIDQDCDGSDADHPDEFEPNNSCAEAYDLNVQDPNEIEYYASIDTASDNYDYFKFYGYDNDLPTNEKIRIWLDNIPWGVDYDVCLYWNQNDCIADNPLACSTNAGTDDEYIEIQEMFPGDDTSTYYVRVSRYSGNACFENYRLVIKGLR